MNDICVSVIIPVFNGENWIQRCINSVLTQTYTNVEVIIVDDGSSDNTGVICNELAIADSRIIVLHQNNKGVNSARWKGVEQSSGEWLVFLDADDILPSKAIELYSSHFYDGAEVLVPGDEDGLINKEEYLQLLLNGDIKPGICVKAFNAAFYKLFCPQLGRELVMGEDLLINLVLGMNVSFVRYVKGNLYVINTNNSESVTKVFKRTWEYEKHYFKVMEDLFLSKCQNWDCYNKLEFLVRKSQLNGIKYVMLSGNKVDYSDYAFRSLEQYFSVKKKELGASERLIFGLKNAFLYRIIMRKYIYFLKKIKGNGS